MFSTKVTLDALSEAELDQLNIKPLISKDAHDGFEITLDATEVPDLADNEQTLTIKLTIELASLRSLSSAEPFKRNYSEMCSPSSCHNSCTDCRVGASLDLSQCVCLSDLSYNDGTQVHFTYVIDVLLQHSP